MAVNSLSSPIAGLHRRITLTGLLYALLVLPTLMLILAGGCTDANLSRLMPLTWEAGVWPFPGLSPDMSEIVLDGLRFLIIGLVTWLYVRNLNTLSRLEAPLTGVERAVIWGAPVLLTLILFLVVPFHSSDLFGYINRGAQQSLSGVNPYLVTVADTPGWQEHPIYHEHWIHNPAPYGFFFVRLAGWLTKLAGNRFWLSVLLFKGLNALLLLGTLALLWVLTRRMSNAHPELAVLAVGTSPLVLLHTLANGHNDILLMALLLAALAALFSPRWAWAALPLWTLSVLTKYASLLALPFIACYLFRQGRWAALAIGLTLSGLVAVVLAAPYLPQGEAWPWHAMLENAGKPQHSFVAMLGHAVYYLTGRNEAAENAVLSLVKPLFLAGFAAWYAWLCLDFVKRPHPSPYDVVRAVGLAILGLIAVASAKFHPWYLVMAWPLLAVLPPASRLFQAGLWLTVFQVLAFTPLQNLHMANVLLLTALPLWLAWREVRLDRLGGST